uniref:Dehydrogenase/reductase SDR family member 11 n=1 Tax=Timema douglasi TaxID=61478 RepID=A0A7R8VBG7_TIMDO|nr:unnamed protein product [Timema douglasi]
MHPIHLRSLKVFEKCIAFKCTSRVHKSEVRARTIQKKSLFDGGFYGYSDIPFIYTCSHISCGQLTGSSPVLSPNFSSIKNGNSVFYELSSDQVPVDQKMEDVQELEAVLKNAPGKLYAVKADVAKEEEILAAFDWIKKNLGGVDIMINNAGLGTSDAVIDVGDGSWQVLDVNVKGLSIFTREALKSMKERGVNDGHIIHINSVLGHSLPTGGNVSMYHASKHAVTVLTEGLRRELVQLGSKIKVTSVSPGVVVTEFMNLYGEERKNRLYAENPTLQSKDIADAVVYTLGTPPHVQIHEIIIKPVGEKF